MFKKRRCLRTGKRAKIKMTASRVLGSPAVACCITDKPMTTTTAANNNSNDSDEP